MRTYAISLEESERRYDYINNHLKKLALPYTIINAVNGRQLTEQEVEAVCDMDTVRELDWWLTRGAIGCALSHYKAYQTFLDSDEELAFIVEDDVLLPPNIKEILASIAKNYQEGEIVLLYFTSFEPTKISTKHATELPNGALMYPMEIEQVMAATAYVMSRKVAKNMMDNIKPIRVTADCWKHFYKEEAIQSLRVYYPAPVVTKHFKSSIDYIKHDSLKGKLTKWIDDKKIPVAFQLVNYLRKRKTKAMLNYELVDSISPIYQKLKENTKEAP